MPKSAKSVCKGSGFAVPRRPGMTIAWVALTLLLSACHGGTLDAIYPGTLGHDPPPAVNLPPQDQGMERL
jgi:hypothetical protein